MYRLVSLLLLFASIGGCGTAIYAPEVGGENISTVTFIRQRAEPTAWNVDVYIDKKKYASIANESFATFLVKPGAHRFEILWPFLAGQVDLDGDLNFDKGKHHYYLITADYTITGSRLVPVMGVAIYYNSSVGLIPLEKSQAEKIIQAIEEK